jgi:hypothetical protein
MSEARGRTIGLGTVLQTASSSVRFPMSSLKIFDLLNLSSRTI